MKYLFTVINKGFSKYFLVSNSKPSAGWKTRKYDLIIFDSWLLHLDSW